MYSLVILCSSSFSIVNHIREKGAESIAEALKVNTTLQTLVLYGIFCALFIFFLSIGNLIGDKGADSIAEALKVNATLQELNLKCMV
jgi:hypothetical protein